MNDPIYIADPDRCENIRVVPITFPTSAGEFRAVPVGRIGWRWFNVADIID